MRITASTAPRRLEHDPRGTIAEGLEEYRAEARARYQELAAGRRSSPQELAALVIDYQRAELELARKIAAA